MHHHGTIGSWGCDDDAGADAKVVLSGAVGEVPLSSVTGHCSRPL
jgi:hypothetical protein